MTRSWEHQEKRVARVVGGERSAGSGAFHRKGDVRAQDTLWECKWTGKTQFTVKASELEKIVSEAIRDSRIPVFAIELNNRNYVLLEEDDYLAMLDV